jgi:hypothetical protein
MLAARFFQISFAPNDDRNRLLRHNGSAEVSGRLFPGRRASEESKSGPDILISPNFPTDCGRFRGNCPLAAQIRGGPPEYNEGAGGRFKQAICRCRAAGIPFFVRASATFVREKLRTASIQSARMTMSRLIAAGALLGMVVRRIRRERSNAVHRESAERNHGAEFGESVYDESPPERSHQPHRTAVRVFERQSRGLKGRYWRSGASTIETLRLGE